MPAGGHRSDRRLGGILKDLVIGVAGLLGVLAIGWAIYAHQTGAPVIVLQTGSMAHDLPAGDGVLSYPVDVTEVEVGDVVTTRLDDASPLVTHRVVRIEPVEGQPDRRALVLKGDANEVEDLFAYDVDWVYRATLPLPHAGPVLSVVRSPWAVGGVAAGIGLLVLWAFWPARLEDLEAELEQDASGELVRP